MGFMGNLEWGNYFGKKRCKSLFWRLRAKLKKALNHGATHKKQLRFQYDPSSYALNFDDGCFTTILKTEPRRELSGTYKSWDFTLMSTTPLPGFVSFGTYFRVLKL
ncbi:uncharacterized protein LOC129307377 [Prosopis cineraria]|uniref:uncharacterized protein LOC129307377 n=1 Tax=Prosopis cineraria TaxID=364024 RepID=UPI00240FA7B2|nr:uncharacterized protein LOC129307377 [Prosopis cineraria]